MKKVAELLLDIGAVSLSPKEPFVWASGIKSPIYCDNRLLLSYPKERKIVEEGLIQLVKEKYPEVEGILGTATAGIPHASIMAWEMDLPTGFIRSKAKDHGKGKQIEGDFQKGQKVVVIEDLFSTGGSSIEAAKAAREAGLEVLGVVSIFTYAMDSCKENFKEAGFSHESLSDFPTLVELALEKGILSQEEVKRLDQWRKNPKDESWCS
ncbi:orotate phosphoribosyltransferase [Peptoniphilus sp. KCTC 25270]|uniref:orotate phosphoribosyltransferase n=1 Tax=Peptoniphilus sp. KCTC 25270 TaxID=2897414 RepID=UPI001E5ECA13|nr:orotate phosphoribosyltransferase [Peptoniphilus sp. KCTC 25270]MCD1146693.1 orotate phosphoribosyltransferase [Peptoniphilus sp. KCTC 25270]